MNAVFEAAELLQRRRDEALHAIDTLRIEVAQIDRALEYLGDFSSQPNGQQNHGADVNEDRFSGLSLTEAIALVLDESRGPWTPAMVRERLDGTSARGGRDDAAFMTSVRTALHNMRKKELAVLVDGKTVATRWLINAETPAPTGVSVSEGSNGDPSQQEGGTANGAASSVGRDVDPDWSDEHHGHGHRASVMEVSVVS